MESIKQLAASALWMIMVMVFGTVLLTVSVLNAQGTVAIPAAAGISTLPAGNYVATVVPVPDQQTANGIEDSLQSVPGVDSASIDGGSSTLQITIESGHNVSVGDLQQVLRDFDSVLTMTTPQLAVR